MLAVLAVVPAVGPAARAQAPPPDSGFPEVEVDLEGQLFTSVLPFDVPFIIHGAVPAGIHQLEVRCWKLAVVATATGRQEVPPDLSTQPDGDCPRWNGMPLVWRNTIAPNATSPTFRLLLPRLDATSTYVFRFSFDKQVTPEEAQAFSDKLVQVVGPILWGRPQETADLPLAGGLSDADLAMIRDRLTAALKAATGADRFPDCARSRALCDTASFAQVRDELDEALLPVRDAQGKIHAAIETYQDRVSQLDALLARLRSDPALLRLQVALAAANQPQAERVSAVLGLAEIPQIRRDDRSSPEAVAAVLQAAKTALATAIQDLGELRNLIQANLAGDGQTVPPLGRQLVESQGLAAGDLDSLRAAAANEGDVGSAQRAEARLQSDVARLESSLADRAQAVDKLAALYQTRVLGMSVIAGSTTGSFATQSRNYISADTGVAYAPGLDDFSTYVGSNIYFRPVNKAAPLAKLGNFRQTLGRRVSLTLGLTVDGVSDGTTREDLFGNQSLVVGLGLRLVNSVRVTAGSLVFLEKDPNPLVDDTSVAVTPFVSLSFDLDVAPTLQGIGGLFRPGS